MFSEPMMELFASNDSVAALETTLSVAKGEARLVTLIRLAWQLRQRDCRRSLQLADEAEAFLGNCNGGDVEVQRSLARLKLVRAEIGWLFADLDDALHHANAAMAAFERLNDHIGMGDGNWLLAFIWGDHGDTKRRDECLDSAIDDYRAGKDLRRVAIGTARSVLYAAFRDLDAIAAQVALSFVAESGADASVKAWADSARAIAVSPSGDFGAAIRYFIHAHHAAMESGQLRQAVLAASNAADNFSILGDLDTALEWDEIALTLARGAGWPSMIGNSLMQTGNVLRLLGRYAEAEKILHEALVVRAGLKNSNGYSVTLGYLGDLSLDIGNPAAALDYFRRAEERASVLGGPISVLRSWRGQALALCRLGQSEEAGTKVAAALALAIAEGSPDEQIDTLRVYAQLFLQHSLPPPEGMTAPGAALHYLHQALAVASSISGYTLPSGLLDEVASAYAASGDYRQAYANACTASAARDSERLDHARNRAMAMQERQETEHAHAEAERQRQLAETARLHAEAEHHRLLAETEAKRATDLQEAGVTLETLGLIGREITASLNTDAVFAALHRNINQLLDATAFFVYLLDADGQILSGKFGVEAGAPIQLPRIPVDDPISLSARCARERIETVIETAPDVVDPTLIPGTLHTLSAIFAPLLIGERLLGVMSIQSLRPGAYGERERSIFRTLCAYGAIALDNAVAYTLAESARQQADLALEELRQSQAKRAQAEAIRISLEAQLHESQKMQAVGTLAGGIAHDFNNILATILGNTELARQDMVTNPAALASLDEIHKAGSRARDLVQQILSFSRRQPIERKRIALGLVIEESVRLLRATMPARMTLDVHCDVDTPAAVADATQIQQVVINLATNAMQAMHGTPGRIVIRLGGVMLDPALAGTHPALGALHERHPGRLVRLVISDDGPGMDAATLARIFEPFFTTKPVDEGTGLGLSVVHGIVQAHEGVIEAASQPGLGATFTIYLPADESAMDSTSTVKFPTATIATPQSGSGRRLLYLDDDESLVSLVKRLMERRGFRVSGYTQQCDALNALRAEPAAFDLVVTDYNMPGISGLEVAREIRTIRADLPVAVASGFIDESLRAEAQGAGVRELIFKASAVEDFCEAFVRLAQAAEKKLA